MSVEVVTFGCRLNGVESEAMRRAATAAGHDDLVIVNTCAVTAEAVRQARQAIRRLRRQRPNASIVVTGCAAQIDPDSFATMPEISRVVGNAAKARPQTWVKTAPHENPASAVATLQETAHVFCDASDGQAGHTRGFVEVQNGCDHRCTFCIIPYGRGPSRSAPIDGVVAQVRRLVEAGFLEVVLTGVDATSYGADLPDAPRLGHLVRRILDDVPALPRLRLSSLDPVEVDDELFTAITADDRSMPHLHLSLQAGDDLVLKRMKRRHSREDAVAFCRRVRAARPDIVFGADLIAGFPTETDAMFERSLALVADCGLTHLHVFPYSPRSGTPAARMPMVDGLVVKQRAKRLREAGAAALTAHLAQQVGKTLEVLSERGGTGRARDFTLVRLPGCEPGRLVAATIVGHDGQSLLAEPSFSLLAGRTNCARIGQKSTPEP